MRSICLTPNHPVKARKDHKCWLCGEPIPKGTIYTKRSGVEPGEGFWTMLLHPECDEAVKHWDADDWEYSIEGALKRGTSEER